MNHSSE